MNLAPQAVLVVPEAKASFCQAFSPASLKWVKAKVQERVVIYFQSSIAQARYSERKKVMKVPSINAAAVPTPRRDWPKGIANYLRVGGHVQTRIADRLVVDGLACSLAVRILVEHDISLILDKLDIRELEKNLGPVVLTLHERMVLMTSDQPPGAPRRTIPALARRARRASEASQLNDREYLSSESRENVRMVVGDLGADVMENMSLGDAVRQESTEPAEEGAGTTKKATVKGRESTALADR